MKRTIFLDSASLRDIAYAEEVGCVGGITMNPSLLAREHVVDVIDHLRNIVHMFSGTIMYQPIALENGYLEDAQRALELDSERICIKVPPLARYMPIARRLKTDGYAVALTAVTTGEQIAIAGAINANYIIPYVDRAANDHRGSDNIVNEIMTYGTGDIPVIAASVKTMQQLSECYFQGAYAVSTSMKVIEELLSEDMAIEAMQSFDLEYNHD
ncbi:hypothetical protein BKH30_07080 [Actinomyces oris]|jgi:putative fructose-6-phosphate aldolase (ISS)|uniref:Transaldolase n=2 Tax=Actinomyces oris TaxID=544580 RepID=A0A1Q8VG14_9ACTO|nr:hypothetical protein BKH31_05675 [Actinomyces oris]OLO52289.1 hypothetical protein BKH30_07080 [Actinomyces oris]